MSACFVKNRQTDGYTDGKTDTQTDRKTHRYTRIGQDLHSQKEE